MPLLRLKLTWWFLLALPLAAQHLLIDPAPVRQERPHTVSAELLRYPLSYKAQHMLQKALQMSDAGDHAGAVKQLQQTLAKYPESGAYVYSLIGVEYLKTSRIPEAVDALEQAVQLLPHDASNHANLGLAWYAEARYDRAELELKRALDLDPHYKMATQVLGMLATAKNTQE
ncbi:MAG: tetratricopeptide repeat protein [Bryobacteraceae bacterium]|jgi:protein O-GlcNAc transferase